MELQERALIASLALCAAACSSTRSRAPVQRLPFHVSVLPIELETAAGAGGAVGIDLDRELLREALARELAGDCFVRVSTPRLPTSADAASLPEGLIGAPASWDRAQLQSYWLHDAAGRSADLLASVSLVYDPALRSSTNGRFWFELPLFLLGGPFCYFVDDRTYELEAVLRMRLYDTQLLADGLGGAEGEGALLADVSAPYDGTSLNFIERAGSGPSDWALSFLMPSGLLAKNTPEVRAAVARDLLSSLMLDFEERLQQQRGELLQPGAVNFFIGPEDLAATRGPAGRIEVRGVVRFRPDARVESLKGFRLSAGDASANHRFGEPRLERGGPDSRTFVYEVSAAVTPSSSVDSVQVQVFHGGGDSRSRSFTLALDSPALAAGRASTSAP